MMDTPGKKNGKVLCQHSLYNNVDSIVFFKAAGHESFDLFFIHTTDCSFMSYLSQRIIYTYNGDSFGFCVSLDNFHAVHVSPGSGSVTLSNSPEFRLRVIGNGLSLIHISEP